MSASWVCPLLTDTLGTFPFSYKRDYLPKNLAGSETVSFKNLCALPTRPADGLFLVTQILHKIYSWERRTGAYPRLQNQPSARCPENCACADLVSNFHRFPSRVWRAAGCCAAVAATLRFRRSTKRWLNNRSVLKVRESDTTVPNISWHILPDEYNFAMTHLQKPVRRTTDSTVRDCGKVRALVVTLYPNGTIGLRPQKTRREEIVTLDSVYSLAVKQRVAKERTERLKRRFMRAPYSQIMQ